MLTDATELGLYRYFSRCVKESTGVDIETYRSQRSKVHEIPFNSSLKWQMSIHNTSTASDGRVKQTLFLKGAPDVLLDKCGFYLTSDGQKAPIDEQFRANYQRIYEEFGGEGERVLGFAMRDMQNIFEEESAADALYKDRLKEDLVGLGRNNSMSDIT